jgi:hypothetical protein
MDCHGIARLGRLGGLLDGAEGAFAGAGARVVALEGDVEFCRREQAEGQEEERNVVLHGVIVPMGSPGRNGRSAYEPGR